MGFASCEPADVLALQQEHFKVTAKLLNIDIYHFIPPRKPVHCIYIACKYVDKTGKMTACSLPAKVSI